METKEKIEFAGLPLAAYREIAAHLLQVEGVEVTLIPQTSEQFDYNQSQISGLWIEYTPNFGAQSRQRVQQILTYYRNRYITGRL
ncbi:hypothetical protein [Mastigocladopsis repens]|uniref:hypothetical protein n=1 Tax=Mastigocladopsis repens TaxID=221287 RepID=UPI00030926A4|nr:hypothetical protein [Mastigocladopsis repens]